MNYDSVILLYDYHDWANQQILDACSHVDHDTLVAPAIVDAGQGGLQTTLVHELDAEYGWRLLLQHGRPSEVLDPADFPTLATIALRWQEERAAWRDYLLSLRDQDLAHTLSYTTDEGHQRTRVLWHCLLHVVNHGTQHRSELATMLTGLGHSPGELDFTVFLNTRAPKAA